MKKNTIITITIVTLGLLFASYYFFFIASPTYAPATDEETVSDTVDESEDLSIPLSERPDISFPPPPTPMTEAEEQEVGSLTRGELTFTTTTGTEIATADIRTLRTARHLGFGQYQLIDQLQNPDIPYAITYDDIQKVFVVALLETPIRESRDAAVVALGELLEVSNEELCQLDVTIFVPVNVHPGYENSVLKLGVCED